ncbi:hypothetical protein PV08_04407 [Exophiala spinifera]|uniref:Zn(2)-C6 fungal-type domain-containing protein n=1 Tax=Exophiala spinifera TaxID=91928 RepID=A0A0D1YPS1_9EURO|nr:uncharacterized protein PV08_04407 [Exophiala spinifera]KIW17216.1 hypothetical protein PV08_04407 [Exophiala spinifera]
MDSADMRRGAPKPPRVSHACTRCQVQKAKCSGAPRCQKCRQEGTLCTFSERRRARLDRALAENRKEIADLESQNRCLVQALRRVLRTSPDLLSKDHHRGLSDLMDEYDHDPPRSRSDSHSPTTYNDGAAPPPLTRSNYNCDYDYNSPLSLSLSPLQRAEESPVSSPDRNGHGVGGELGRWKGPRPLSLSLLRDESTDSTMSNDGMDEVTKARAAPMARYTTTTTTTTTTTPTTCALAGGRDLSAITSDGQRRADARHVRNVNVDGNVIVNADVDADVSVLPVTSIYYILD